MMDEKNANAAGNETMNESEDSQQPAWHCDICATLGSDPGNTIRCLTIMNTVKSF